jgi:putative MFS transporter
MLGSLSPQLRRQALLVLVVASLGYFVDIFDLLLFSMVRLKSLQSLGVAPADMLVQGARLISLQMYGMLLGGVLWGVMGDKRGRLSVLFGSIILYSIANLANAYAQTVDQYALWRFLAGVGLAGELGPASPWWPRSCPRRAAVTAPVWWRAWASWAPWWLTW